MTAVVAMTAVAGLLVGMLPPAGAQTAGPTDCPQAMPVSDLHRGMKGTGWTVAQGTEPEPFDAEILGVLQDGIAPGRDLIIVDAHSPAIDHAGGIWYGMSGSPIYIDNRLVGAISYGLSFGPSTVAGVTPAEDMMDLLSYPPADDSSASAASEPQRVKMSPAARRSVARQTDSRRQDVSNEFVQLKLPLSVSGVGARAIGKIAKMLDREHAPFVPYAGSAASTQTSTTTDVHAGDNFAGALSYGDLTLAGVGTATIVCDGKVVSFGHPFDFTGESSLGANQADAITVVDDPVFGAYKLANVTTGLGTLDQDRLAGVRTLLGNLPPTIPVTATIDSLSNGKTRTGETDVVDDEYLGFLAYYHVFLNILVAMDEYSEGSADVSWTITGTRADGSEWSFERQNVFTSRYSIADSAPYELSNDLYALYNNDFEEIHFTGIDIHATVREEIEQYKLKHVTAAVNDGEPKTGRRLHVQPGDVITLSETLHPLTLEGEKNDDTSQDQLITQTVQIPEDAKREATLQVTGGDSDYSREICLYRPRRCDPGGDGKIDTFDEYLATLEGLPHNNDVLAHLYTGRHGKIAVTVVDTVDRLVSGRKYFTLRFGRGGGSEGPTVTSGSGGGGGKD